MFALLSDIIHQFISYGKEKNIFMLIPHEIMFLSYFAIATKLESFKLNKKHELSGNSKI